MAIVKATQGTAAGQHRHRRGRHPHGLHRHGTHGDGLHGHGLHGHGERPGLRGLAGVLGDVLLTVGAVIGAICIVAAIAAFAFGFRIVLFGSGSMAPAIPQGSAAVVIATPAVDVRVGDVVTVDRGRELPVTHRVVAIEEVPGMPDARRLTLRGDANAVDDPKPYDVASVGRLVVSVPGMAPVVAAVGQAPVLLGATIVAAGFVLWAFWPRRQAT